MHRSLLGRSTPGVEQDIPNEMSYTYACHGKIFHAWATFMPLHSNRRLCSPSRLKKVNRRKVQCCVPLQRSSGRGGTSSLHGEIKTLDNSDAFRGSLAMRIFTRLTSLVVRWGCDAVPRSQTQRLGGVSDQTFAGFWENL